MAHHTVRFTKSAKREFDSLAVSIQGRILEGLRLLEHNPYSELLRIKKLRGADSLYRFRVGDYRVVYTVQQSILVVLVIKIGHRKEVYR